MSDDQLRGCGGTLRIVTRPLHKDELGRFAVAGQRAHAVCDHPDGTVHEYPGIPTPGEQFAHEFSAALAGGDHHHDVERQPMSDNDTGNDIGDEWHRLGTILVVAAMENRKGKTVEAQTPLTVEANGPARRLTMDVDPDQAPVLVARWRDPVPESLNVFPIDELPATVLDALRDQLKAFIAGDMTALTTELTLGEDCTCHTPAGRLDMLHHLRRLYYAAELATRSGGELLGKLNSDINREAHDLYDQVTTDLIKLGPIAQPAGAALATLRRAAINRARIDGALAALAAVPPDPDLAGPILKQTQELMRAHDAAQTEEHDAITTLAIALAGTE